MRNTDYVIYLTTKHGRTWRYLKDKIGWRQIGPEDQVHQMTAEQVLNHLLPPLAAIKPLTVNVVYKMSKAKCHDPVASPRKRPLC